MERINAVETRVREQNGTLRRCYGLRQHPLPYQRMRCRGFFAPYLQTLSQRLNIRALWVWAQQTSRPLLRLRRGYKPLPLRDHRFRTTEHGLRRAH